MSDLQSAKLALRDALTELAFQVDEGRNRIDRGEHVLVASDAIMGDLPLKVQKVQYYALALLSLVDEDLERLVEGGQ